MIILYMILMTNNLQITAHLIIIQIFYLKKKII